MVSVLFSIIPLLDSWPDSQIQLKGSATFLLYDFQGVDPVTKRRPKSFSLFRQLIMKPRSLQNTLDRPDDVGIGSLAAVSKGKMWLEELTVLPPILPPALWHKVWLLESATPSALQRIGISISCKRITDNISWNTTT